MSTAKRLCKNWRGILAIISKVPKKLTKYWTESGAEDDIDRATGSRMIISNIDDPIGPMFLVLTPNSPFIYIWPEWQFF